MGCMWRSGERWDRQLQISLGSLLFPSEIPAAEQPDPCLGLQDKLWVMLPPSLGGPCSWWGWSLISREFCSPREQLCSTHLAWGGGITSPAAPWHTSGCKFPASGPEERPAGGKVLGEPIAKSPSWELVGRAQALLLTGPAVLFPFPEVWGGRRNLLQAKIPGILFFKHRG